MRRARHPAKPACFRRCSTTPPAPTPAFASKPRASARNEGSSSPNGCFSVFNQITSKTVSVLSQSRSRRWASQSLIVFSTVFEAGYVESSTTQLPPLDPTSVRAADISDEDEDDVEPWDAEAPAETPAETPEVDVKAAEARLPEAMEGPEIERGVNVDPPVLLQPMHVVNIPGSRWVPPRPARCLERTKTLIHPLAQIHHLQGSSLLHLPRDYQLHSSRLQLRRLLAEERRARWCSPLLRLAQGIPACLSRPRRPVCILKQVSLQPARALSAAGRARRVLGAQT